MNDRKFDVFQHAADQTMLEEAQRPMKKNHIRARAAAAAACVCVVAAAVILQPWNSSETGDPPGNGGNVQIANPWSDTTLAQIRAMGYALTLPDGAENAAFTALNADETDAEMVQASYTLDGTAYTCRAAKASDPEDISGLYETWDQDLSWTVGEAQLQLCTNNLTGYVSWFLPDEGQQWCVSSSSSSDAELLENARILAAGLGQELATAPEGAEDVVISVFSQDGRTVAETAFTLSGARWVYRTAPGELELVDISGLGSFSLSAAGKVSYCDAQLSYDEGGAGKIIWFDIVPGIEYSLSVDTGASAEALTNMADTLFIPMLSRLYASEYCPQILYDPKALELKKKLPSSLPEQDGQSQYTLLASAARSANMDRFIRAFLERRPDGVIVQLGCRAGMLWTCLMWWSTGGSCCRSRSGRPISPGTPLPETGSGRSARMRRMLLFWSPPAACSTILRKARLWASCGCSRGLERSKSSLTP